MTKDSKYSDKCGSDTGASGEEPQRFLSRCLFAGQRRIIIEHEGVDYVLQITRQGKLILTK